MTRVLKTKPENTTIELRLCFDRGGHPYKHAFIDGFAISSKLERLLANEFGVSMRSGNDIPDEFFKKYRLVEVHPDYSDPNRESFVTSDYWYTYKASVLSSSNIFMNAM